MQVIKTKIEGVVVLEPRVFGDDRGYFFESYTAKAFEREIPGVCFVQDNEAKSRYGVLRGLHYQLPPHAQSKLVRVVRGRILDVAVDIRRGSPTFGQHVAWELSGENRQQLFIPKGFAHGYVVLSEETVMMYKCDDYYFPEYERGIRFDDPALRVDWGIPAEHLILSEKDRKQPFWGEADIF